MKHILLSTLTVTVLMLTVTVKAQNNMKTNEELLKNDPELNSIIQNFAFGETREYGTRVDTRTTAMLTLVSCIAQQAVTEYAIQLESAWQAGLTPIELKEVLYQAVPYVGIAKVADFIALTNNFLTNKGVDLPIESQATTSLKTRFSEGLKVQKGIFGETIDKMRNNAPHNQAHIQDYLSANCFGDYYTRKGIGIKEREVLTFAILISMGGCESQVKGHIQGNLNVGNDKEYLLEVVTRLLPFIGYPRTLNAINCLNEVIPESEHQSADTDIPQNISIFPVGSPNPPVNSKYFTGRSFLAPLTKEKALNCPVYNVTFEPGCRNNWHSHTGGQLLIAVGGKGYYQEEGKPARLLLPGDIVEIAPNIVHWHGAAPDSWFSHLAIECNPQTNKTTWMDVVDDTQYEDITNIVKQ